MHGGSSNINVPVDVTITGAGCATRDGRLAPTQSFVRITSGSLKPGDRLFNPGTHQLHRVVSVCPHGVTITVKPRGGTRIDHVVSAESWEDVIAALWLVVE